MPRPKGARPPNAAHHLYESWKGHRKRGLRKTMTFWEYVALATAGGYREGHGHRIVLNSAKTDISVERHIDKEPAYDVWIRMMITADTHNFQVCPSWTDCLVFQEWLLTSLGKYATDLGKVKYTVFRHSPDRPYSPFNCYIV